MCAAEIADTPLATGQGMHGTFSRADTRNFMAAIGPDFKARFADRAPVSNADINPTLAGVLGLTIPARAASNGRPSREALKGGKAGRVQRMSGRCPPPAAERPENGSRLPAGSARRAISTRPGSRDGRWA